MLKATATLCLVSCVVVSAQPYLSHGCGWLDAQPNPKPYSGGLVDVAFATTVTSEVEALNAMALFASAPTLPKLALVVPDDVEEATYDRLLSFAMVVEVEPFASGAPIELRFRQLRFRGVAAVVWVRPSFVVTDLPALQTLLQTTDAQWCLTDAGAVVGARIATDTEALHAEAIAANSSANAAFCHAEPSDPRIRATFHRALTAEPAQLEGEDAAEACSNDEQVAAGALWQRYRLLVRRELAAPLGDVRVVPLVLAAALEAERRARECRSHGALPAAVLPREGPAYDIAIPGNFSAFNAQPARQPDLAAALVDDFAAMATGLHPGAISAQIMNITSAKFELRLTFADGTLPAAFDVVQRVDSATTAEWPTTAGLYLAVTGHELNMTKLGGLATYEWVPGPPPPRNEALMSMPPTQKPVAPTPDPRSLPRPRPTLAAPTFDPRLQHHIDRLWQLP